MFCDIARQSVSQPWVFPYITGMYEHISRSGNIATLNLDLNDSQRLVLGSAVEDIGIHGFRKGAFTFASNDVDGPPQTAIELRGNHSQCTIKDM